jgi:PhnB protein
MSAEHQVSDNPFPAYSRGVLAYVSVPDANAAGEFYQRAFGAEELNRAAAEDGKRLMHLHLRINGGSFLVMDFFPESCHPQKEPAAFTLHMDVDDVDATFSKAVDAGAKAVMPPQDMFWGARYAQVEDPWGIVWAMGGPAKG